MRTVVELKAQMPSRRRPLSDDVIETFRDDVRTYGAALYDVLRHRRDFADSDLADTEEPRPRRRAAKVD